MEKAFQLRVGDPYRHFPIIEIVDVNQNYDAFVNFRLRRKRRILIVQMAFCDTNGHRTDSFL
jgi:hypothetical protein